MFRTPEIFVRRSISFAVVLIEDEAFELPYLAAPDEVLGPKVAMPVTVHIDGVDCFEYLIKYLHDFLFIEGLFLNAHPEIALVRFSDQASEFLIGYSGLDIKQMLPEDAFLNVFQDFSIELKTLIIA
jgi:hypothetical protein